MTKDCIDNATCGVRRLVPPITICATFVALASFTAALPVSVANGRRRDGPAESSIRTGLPGGSPQSHVFDVILEGARRRRAACSRLPSPWDEAA